MDYQASAPLDERVYEAMAPYLKGWAGNPHSSDHILGWRAQQALDAAAAKVGALVGADPDEVIFTSGATEADNLAIVGLANAVRKPARRRILVSAIEHKAVFAAAASLVQQGFVIEHLPVDTEGRVDREAAAEAMGEDVLLVSVMAVNNEIGTIEPITELFELARQYGALTHTDAAQSPCAIDTAHLADFVDLISLSAHKIYGPQGIGALVARREYHAALCPIIHGGGQQNGLRSGTVPVALGVGMGTAAEILQQEEAAAERTRIAELRDRFVDTLLQSRWSATLNGPPLFERHPGNANLCFKGCNGQDLLGMLQPHLAASTGSACTTGIPEPSHVLAAIGLTAKDAEGSIRFSLGRFTTPADVEEAVTFIEEALSRAVVAESEASA